MLDPHHIAFRSAGGEDIPENIITLCRSHHNLAQSLVITATELREILVRLFSYEYEDQL